MIADRNSWETSPPPAERAEFKVNWTFPSAVGKRMMDGHVPEGMDDRWFILMEDGWLLFHRSWTGSCIFGLKVDELQDAVTISEGWVRRKGDMYNYNDLDEVVELAHTLVGEYFIMPPSPPSSPFMAPE